MSYREMSTSDISRLIDEWVKDKVQSVYINERNRKILKRRLLDGIQYERLAEEFDLSVRQVKTIVYKNQTWLFKHCK